MISSSPQLQEAKAQLDAAQSQLDEQRNSAEQTFQDKEDELESSVPNVRWYVQDRSSLGGYSALKSDLSSIRSIGNAFPVVFLLVAVMMSRPPWRAWSKRTVVLSAPTSASVTDDCRSPRATCYSHCLPA